MKIADYKYVAASLVIVAFLLTSVAAAGAIPAHKIDSTTPSLLNPGLECDVGYDTEPRDGGSVNRIPLGWTYTALSGAPKVNSARIQFGGSCEDESAHVERIEGRDSLVIRSRDIETPPAPGKPFDAAFYQQTTVIPGVDYSISGWMLSLCGGSANPSDCPDNYYIAKLLGLDPTGGVDPNAESVIWVENRLDRVDGEGRRLGWANLYTSAVAETMTMTVFARVTSPFQWHGNHAFVDAISLVRAPEVAFVDLPEWSNSPTLEISWAVTQSVDIVSIPGSTHRLLVDIQYRHVDRGEWKNLVVDYPGAGSTTFTATCTNTSYDFRNLVRAEQPPPPPDGAWPNHRYPSTWSTPITVRITSGDGPPLDETGPFKTYLPLLVGGQDC